MMMINRVWPELYDSARRVAYIMERFKRFITEVGLGPGEKTCHCHESLNSLLSISRNLNGVLQIDLYNTENEEIHINKNLVQKGFAHSVDPCDLKSLSSVDSGRPTSRSSSHSSVSSRKKHISGAEVEVVYLPG
jgi:hypothetical protein